MDLPHGNRYRDPFSFSADPAVLRGYYAVLPHGCGYRADSWISRYGTIPGAEVYYDTEGNLSIFGVSDPSVRAGIVNEERKSYHIREYIHRMEHRERPLLNWQGLMEPFTLKRRDGTVSVAYGERRVRLGSQILADNLYRCKVTLDEKDGKVTVTECLPGLDTIIADVIHDIWEEGGSLPR